VQELKELKIGDFVGFMKPEDLTRSQRITLTDTARWYCAVVKANRHRRAELDLGQLGFRSFYPKSRKWASHARIKTAKEYPILGRYIFVEIDHPRQSYLTVDGVIYIDDLIKNQGKPVVFPSHWIEGLLTRYLSGEWDEISNGKVPVGARIRIVEGEFQDQLATVLGTKGRRIDFQLLGDTKQARIDQSSVRAA
jgi:transcription antitermination factor NusG